MLLKDKIADYFREDIEPLTVMSVDHSTDSEERQ